MPLMTGRLPAVHTQRQMRSALAMARVLDPLGPPPRASRDWRVAVNARTGGDWGMYGNNIAGDCTMADGCHTIMLRTANASSIFVPPDGAALVAYSTLTGYRSDDAATDNGANEVEVCNFMQTIGISGHRSDRHGAIDPMNLDHVRWCIELFGSCRLGILVTPAMIQQFENGRQPWTRMLSDAPGEGHDVPLVHYDSDGAVCVTWAGEQRISWELLADPRFLSEAHAELYFDWIRSQGDSPSGVANLGLLEQYLAEVDATTPMGSVSTALDYGAIEGTRHGVARSPHWTTVEREVREKNPLCAACDPSNPADHAGLQVHHRYASFHVAVLLGRPDLELDERNLCVLGETEAEKPAPNCHLAFGHGFDFRRDCNPHIDEDIATMGGLSAQAMKLDPRWLAHAADLPPPWDEWTQEMKDAKYLELWNKLPPDPAVLARFGIAPPAAPN